MTVRRLGPFFALVLLGGALSNAQEYRGRVQGVVTDSTGALVPGATLQLKNNGTGVQLTRVSNEQGLYVFDYVDPGSYTLSAEMTGFKKFIQPSVLVQQRGDVTVDPKMETGAIS